METVGLNSADFNNQKTYAYTSIIIVAGMVITFFPVRLISFDMRVSSALTRYTPRTFSYANELASVYIFYSQGNGFTNPLSIFYILYTLCSYGYGSVIVVGTVVIYVLHLPRTTVIKIMCVHYLHLQG